MNNIGLIIRFHYQECDSRVAWRYQHFVNKVLPRIQSQSYKDFDTCVWCYDWHKEMFERYGLKTFSVVSEEKYERYIIHNNKPFYEDFTPWECVYNLQQYETQVRLDSDDYIKQEFMYKVYTTVEDHKQQFEDKTLFLSFQPRLLRLSTGNAVPMLNYAENKWGSAFAALYQPLNNNTQYRFIYDSSHLTFGNSCDRQIWIHGDYCLALAHSLNESTGKW